MITASLTVTGYGGDDAEESWDPVGLACPPSSGDMIKVWRSNDFHFVRVETVLHHSVLWPLPEDGSLHRQQPSIQIFAKWVTIDPTSYRYENG